MPTVSLCMIVRDEQRALPFCLNSAAKLADELIVVDTGSTDRTRQVAEKHGAKIFDFPWVDDFSAARNHAFDQATQEWLLWLDADDLILPADRERFLALKAKLDPARPMVLLPYDVGFEQSRLTSSYWRERLFLRSSNPRWLEPVHEYVPLAKDLAFGDARVTHMPRTFKAPGRHAAVYERLLARGSALSPRGLFYYGRELRDSGRLAEAIAQFNAFLPRADGWPEGQAQACIDMGECHWSLNDFPAARKAVVRSFDYAPPRAEACCTLAWWHLQRNDLHQAVAWYEMAAGLKQPVPDFGFSTPAAWGIGPHLQLCLCYSRLGNAERARWHNERAAEFEPGNSTVLHNRAVLS
jgi:tetratricopeptide (TPR) repeat protein